MERTYTVRQRNITLLLKKLGIAEIKQNVNAETSCYE